MKLLFVFSLCFKRFNFLHKRGQRRWRRYFCIYLCFTQCLVSIRLLSMPGTFNIIFLAQGRLFPFLAVDGLSQTHKNPYKIMYSMHTLAVLKKGLYGTTTGYIWTTCHEVTPYMIICDMGVRGSNRLQWQV